MGEHAVKTSETTAKIWQALIQVQSGLAQVKKSGKNAHTRSSYATLSDILSLVRPALNKVGIVLLQYTGRTEDGKFAVFTRLVHAESSEFIETQTEIAVDQSAKNQAHALGSAITYGSRYGMASLLGIECVEDDDGNAAGGTNSSSAVQTARFEKQKENLPGVYELTEEFKEYVAGATREELREKYKSFTEGQQQYIVKYLNRQTQQQQ